MKILSSGLHTYDWEMFKAERNYQQRHIDTGTFPDIASDDSPALPRNAKDFLNNIEDERLYRLLRRSIRRLCKCSFSKALVILQKKLNSESVCRSP